MQAAADDFEEIPITQPNGTAPAPIGHNAPPDGDADETPEQRSLGAILDVFLLWDEAPDLLRAALGARLAGENVDVDQRLEQFHASLAKTPEKIADAETATKVADFVSLVMAAEKRVDERFGPNKAPFLDLGRTVDGFFNQRRKALADIKTTLLNRSTAWQNHLREEERQRLARVAEQQRREAEAQRLAAEKRRQDAEAAAEAGRMDQAIAMADKAAEDAENARVAQAEAEAAQQRATAPIPASATAVKGSFGGSIGTRTAWTFRVDDKAKLPVEYLLPDESLIRAKVASLKKAKQLEDGHEYANLISGVTILQETSTRGRG